MGQRALPVGGAFTLSKALTQLMLVFYYCDHLFNIMHSTWWGIPSTLFVTQMGRTEGCSLLYLVPNNHMIQILFSLV